MDTRIIDLLDRLFSQHPVLKAETTPTLAEILAAEKTLCVTFDKSYIEFLQRYGAGIVGAVPIFGLRPVHALGVRWSVIEVTNEYRAQFNKNVHGLYVISEDGSGNPIWMEENGDIIMYDHDQSITVPLAANLEDYLFASLT